MHRHKREMSKNLLDASIQLKWEMVAYREKSELGEGDCPLCQTLDCSECPCDQSHLGDEYCCSPALNIWVRESDTGGMTAPRVNGDMLLKYIAEKMMAYLTEEKRNLEMTERKKRGITCQ
jgi:hypothetical protein